VEADANIIFGATFDEGLEGIIRVSVVATGIDQERLEEPLAPPNAGMAELARRLKSVGAPGAAAQTQHHHPRESVPAYALAGLEQELAAQHSQRPGAPGQGQRAPAQGRAPVDPSVRIGPFRPDPSLIAARQAEIDAEHARGGPGQHFIPPAAERPDELQPRMPRVEDFPPVAQRQMRAQHSGHGGQDDDRRPRGLLARLASGLTRRDDEPEASGPRESSRAREASRPAPEPEPRVVASQPPPNSASATATEFVRQAQPRRMGESSGAAGGLDTRGRPVPTEHARDDHLEIPAFLRRQSS
jgi:cell division protein FtsZ